jgi:hypothetical protein
VRKRLVIGAIAAVLIGVAAYILSQPKKGTVEWHKSAYLKELEGFGQPTSLLDRVVGAIEGVTGVTLSPNGPQDALDQHLHFLLSTGVVVSTVFPLRNEDWFEIATNTVAEAGARIPRPRLRYVYMTGNETSLWVVSLPEGAPVWVELINKRAK